MFSGLATFGLVVAVLAVPSGAATRTALPQAAQGVDKDKIQIVVLVPDIDALKAKGINTQSRSTTQGFAQRFSAYVDAYGPINGREIEVTPVGWDPIDPTSFDKACTAATQDNQPFLVVNGSGYRASSIACLSVDNDTPFYYGDMANKTLLEASGKNLVTVAVAPEDAAATAASVVDDGGLIAKSAKIGILSNNEPGVKAAGDALEAALEKRGYEVASKVEVNGLAGDPTLLTRETATAANTFAAEGVDTVFNVQAFTQLDAFFQEVERSNLDFDMYAIDGQANACTPVGSGISRAPAAALGTKCITGWGGRTLATRDGLRPDTEFEARCREEFDAATGRTSTPGGPSGDLTVNGTTYVEDIPASECTMAAVLLPAIEKAGKNPTWDKVYANIMKTKKTPAAYMSNGEGGYAKNKPYVPTHMHVVEMVGANADTAEDANGLFNGCPVPANCWIPVVTAGQEWFPIVKSGGG